MESILACVLCLPLPSPHLFDFYEIFFITCIVLIYVQSYMWNSHTASRRVYTTALVGANTTSRKLARTKGDHTPLPSFLISTNIIPSHPSHVLPWFSFYKPVYSYYTCIYIYSVECSRKLTLVTRHPLCNLRVGVWGRD